MCVRGGIVSQKPGYVIVYYIDASGRRVLEWRRRGKIHGKTVEHFKTFIRGIKADVLEIVFIGKPEITDEAFNKLKEMFGEIRITSEEPLHREETEEFYDGKVVVMSRIGRLRIYEADRVPLNDEKNVWLLIISWGRDGKLRIYDAKTRGIEAIKREAINKTDMTVVLAVWHGKWRTDLFLVYPIQ